MSPMWTSGDRGGRSGRMYELNILFAGALVALSIGIPPIANGKAGIGSWLCAGLGVAILLLLLGWVLSPAVDDLRDWWRRRKGA